MHHVCVWVLYWGGGKQLLRMIQLTPSNILNVDSKHLLLLHFLSILCLIIFSNRFKS